MGAASVPRVKMCSHVTLPCWSFSPQILKISVTRAFPNLSPTFWSLAKEFCGFRTSVLTGFGAVWDCKEPHLTASPGTSPKRRMKREERHKPPPNRVVA